MNLKEGPLPIDGDSDECFHCIVVVVVVVVVVVAVAAQCGDIFCVNYLMLVVEQSLFT